MQERFDRCSFAEKIQETDDFIQNLSDITPDTVLPEDLQLLMQDLQMLTKDRIALLFWAKATQEVLLNCKIRRIDGAVVTVYDHLLPKINRKFEAQYTDYNTFGLMPEEDEDFDEDEEPVNEVSEFDINSLDFMDLDI